MAQQRFCERKKGCKDFFSELKPKEKEFQISSLRIRKNKQVSLGPRIWMHTYPLAKSWPCFCAEESLVSPHHIISVVVGGGGLP